MTLQVNMNAMMYNNWYSACSILMLCSVEATFKPLTVTKHSHFMMGSHRYHWTTWLVKYQQLLPMHQNQVLIGDLLLAHPLKRSIFLKWENQLLYVFFHIVPSPFVLLLLHLQCSCSYNQAKHSLKTEASMHIFKVPCESRIIGCCDLWETCVFENSSAEKQKELLL